MDSNQILNRKELLKNREDLRYTIYLCKRYKIQIFKPLILLKICLFIFFGAGSFASAFITVLYKQRGVSLKEISTMYILAPITQILFSAVSGIVADKLGRTKPVFVANILGVMTITICILYLPPLIPTTCQHTPSNITCGLQNLKSNVPHCDRMNKTLEAWSCSSFCRDECTFGCTTTNNFSLRVEDSNFLKGDCYYTVNVNDELCESENMKNCNMSCLINECPDTLNFSHKGLLVAYAILYILYLTTNTSAYRMMDVTVMTLTKEHGGDYGHERFFSISGNLIVSPIGGYVSYVTATDRYPNNYESSLYLNLAMYALLLVLMYFLKVPSKCPGQNMGKKSLKIFTDPDVLMFFFMLLLLGTSWNFSKYYTYWYLEDLGASSMLLGLVTSFSALYGLPFLMTSKFWLLKLGAPLILLLSHVAYVIFFLSYSFLVDTWVSLIIESLGVLTYYLMWVAVIEHSHDIAPEGITSFVISFSGAVHFSAGKASVGLTAGQIMSAYGGRVAYRFMASMCLIAGTFFTIYYFCRKKCSTKWKDAINR